MISGPTSSRADDRLSILLVDDHAPNLIALDAVLDSLGFELVHSSSGSDALLKSIQRDFVLIFMDVHMPVLDGYQTVELLRQQARNRDVPILFITAINALEEHVHRGYALGAADFITKPFDPVVVRAKVKALVSLYTRGQRSEQGRAGDMDRLKDQVLGALGNELQSMAKSARSMKDDEAVPEARRRTIATIERTALRMGGAIEQLLDLSAASVSGAIVLKRQTADLGALVRSVVAEVQSAHPERSIQVEVVGDTTGEWDATRVGRAVGNLARNATHHARESPVSVRVAGERDRVTLAVRYPGAPISPHLLPSLFEPFRRGGSGAEGYGLDLHVVREIARAHGGSVDARSSATDGTAFVVTLPRKPTASP